MPETAWPALCPLASPSAPAGALHQPKVGCSGEGAIYPKSYDRRGPESAADQARFQRSGTGPLPEAHPGPRNPMIT